MTVSLASEYRPRLLSEILGQARHVKAIRKMIETGDFPGAILLAGPSGTGKTSSARVIARLLVCRDRKGETPCGTCEGCRSVDIGRGVNYFTLDGGTKDMAEVIREEMIPFFMAKPVGARHKVLILDEFQRVSGASKSLLLEPLEELPTRFPWVVVMFTTTDPETIHEALRNRCYPVRFRPIPTVEMVQAVTRIRPELEQYREGLTLLAERSEGCMRQLWVYIQQYDLLDEPLTPELAAWMTGGVTAVQREKLWKVIETGKIDQALKLWDRWIEEGANPQLLGEILTNDAVQQASMKPDSGPWIENLKMLAATARARSPHWWRWAIAELQPAPFRKPDPVTVTWSPLEGVEVTDTIVRETETERAIDRNVKLTPPAESVKVTVTDTPEASAAMEVTKRRESLEAVAAKLNENKIVQMPKRTVQTEEQKLDPVSVVLEAFSDPDSSQLESNTLPAQFDPWAMDYQEPQKTKPTFDLTDLKAVYEVLYG